MNSPVRSSTERCSARGLSFAVHRTVPDARAADERLVVLLHGFQDSGATFADVARPLAERGLEVVAPDQRGFGRTSWVSRDAYYHFPDYVADLDALLDELDPSGARPLVLLGHSMGGTVASLYAGARPERLTSLVLVEGIGPPDMPGELALERTRSWLDGLRALRPHETFASADEALERLARYHHDVPREVLARVLPDLLDEQLRWSFDPRHRTRSPTPFQAAALRAFLSAVSCPVLWVSGGPRGFHPPDEDERLACFARLTRRELSGGHMLHWVQPAELAGLVLEHLGA